jgi:hypothetical protein
MTQKQRYRVDAVYRADVLRRNRDRHESRKKDPLYHALYLSRDRVYKCRESYNARVAHAERLFKKLQRLIKRRDELAAKWRERGNNGLQNR